MIESATRRTTLLTSLAAAAGLLGPRPSSAAQGGAAASVHDLALQVLAAVPDQPGFAIAVVEDGEITLARGYGVARQGQASACDEHTLFPIASNTKAMTAALIAGLVDEGKLDWDKPVRAYMPDFALSDPVVSDRLTVRDLLVHRSGLALGAGDLMFFPKPKDRTRADLVAGLRYLPLATPFRASFAYDNVLYVAAGLLVERVTGKSWEEALQERILSPLGMTESSPAFASSRRVNVASGHARMGPPIRGLGPMQVVAGAGDYDLAAPAGGVRSSATDMARWLRALVRRGDLGGGKRVYSEAAAAELVTPQTLVGASDGAVPENPARAVLTAYAPGWFVQDWRGERLLQHDGAITGFGSAVGYFPRRRSGIAILTNAEERRAIFPLVFGGFDRLQGRTDFDWIAFGQKAAIGAEEDLREQSRQAATSDPARVPPTLPLARYAGVYRSAWYGTVSVRTAGPGLAVSFDRTEGGAGALEPWTGDTFRTRFTNPVMEDALLTFKLEGGRVVSASAKALSPTADFSFDYQDLDLRRVG